MPGPQSRNRFGDSSYAAHHPLNVEGPPSPTSSFEEVPHPSTWSTNRNYNQPPQGYHATEEEQLPLPHYMAEDKARRRHAGPEKSGWAGPSDANELSTAYGYEMGEYSQDGDEKGVYGKPRPAYGPTKLGPMRPRKPAPPSTDFVEILKDNADIITPIVYTLLACWTRFRKIGASNHVVWDEAHFGKFGSHYLKREFYFDVHPPLGKMIVGLVGLLAGYDGSFEFKSGEGYPDTVPYVAMRVMLALFGVGMVPIGWLTAKELHLSNRACHIVTLMVLLDCAWLCISRFILLDSMLLFFTFTTAFCLTKFNNQQHDPFSLDWWVWLSITGLSIGSVISVKWVGFFVTALVGLYTIEDLWEKFGDLRMPVQTYVRHWIARAVCLIMIPAMVYLASFKLHFIVLNHSGPGDAQMSSLFQANLIGNDFGRNPLEIAYGSRITLKNMGWGGGLLHSHVQTYPTGSQQGQVTCYHYKDDNNAWHVYRPWDQPAVDWESAEIDYLKDRDVIRLQHVSTTRNLHSHTVPAPVTKGNHEVSCYGNSTVGDIHDYWIVEVVDDLVQGRRDKVEHIHSLTTRLRFKHKVLGCYLRAANAILPQWGFKQVEVSCDKENNPGDIHTYWNVESHWNDHLPPAEMKHYRSPFLRDFWHLNVAMMTSNNALIPDPDKEDILASTPSEWPWLHVGLRMCGWGDTQIKYYLLGTPVIWWGGTASLALSIFVLAGYLMRMQRKYMDFQPGEWEHFLYVLKISLGGWLLHYCPFLIMGRVTYIHHYLPALWFSVLMCGHLIDHFIFKSRRLSEKTKWIAFGIISSIIIGTFWWFKDIAFGILGPINDHKGLMWRKTWNIYS